MGSLTKRPAIRSRPILMLETLEDRRVMSAGGLLSAFQPFAMAEASHSPVNSVLSSLVALPTDSLSSVNQTIQGLDGVALAGPLKTTIGDVSPHAAGLGVQLNLNADVLFLHAENLRLDVGLSPVSSQQPLLALAVDVGSTSHNALLNIVPDVSLDVGGSSASSVGVETQVGASTGSVLDLHADAGGQGGSAVSVHVGGVPGVLDVPSVQLPEALTGTGATLVTPVVNLGNINNAGGSNFQTALPTVLAGAPSVIPVLTAPTPIGIDGGGVDSDAALAVLPGTNVAIADGAGAGVIAAPIDLGGGTEVETVQINAELEASGPTTRFQPYALDGGVPNIQSLFATVGPQTNWLAAFWARFTHMAPWLAGLIVAGVAFEIRRRRAAKAI